MTGQRSVPDEREDKTVRPVQPPKALHTLKTTAGQPHIIFGSLAWRRANRVPRTVHPRWLRTWPGCTTYGCACFAGPASQWCRLHSWHWAGPETDKRKKVQCSPLTSGNTIQLIILDDELQFAILLYRCVCVCINIYIHTFFLSCNCVFYQCH